MKYKMMRMAAWLLLTGMVFSWIAKAQEVRTPLRWASCILCRERWRSARLR